MCRCPEHLEYINVFCGRIAISHIRVFNTEQTGLANAFQPPCLFDGAEIFDDGATQVLWIYFIRLHVWRERRVNDLWHSRGRRQFEVVVTALSHLSRALCIWTTNSGHQVILGFAQRAVGSCVDYTSTDEANSVRTSSRQRCLFL